MNKLVSNDSSSTSTKFTVTTSFTFLVNFPDVISFNPKAFLLPFLGGGIYLSNNRYLTGVKRTKEVLYGHYFEN